MSVESTLASLAHRPGQAAHAALNFLTASADFVTGFGGRPLGFTSIATDSPANLALGEAGKRPDNLRTNGA